MNFWDIAMTPNLMFVLFQIHTSTLTWPRDLFISPNIADIREDFPAPTLPTTATRLPLGTLTLMLKSVMMMKWIRLIYPYLNFLNAYTTLMLMPGVTSHKLDGVSKTFERPTIMTVYQKGKDSLFCIGIVDFAKIMYTNHYMQCIICSLCLVLEY